MVKLGRHELSAITEVVSLTRRTGWRSWLPWTRGYNALLSNGNTVHFNEAEKQAYDEARGLHEAVMYCYGVARAAGLRG